MGRAPDSSRCREGNVVVRVFLNYDGWNLLLVSSCRRGSCDGCTRLAEESVSFVVVVYTARLFDRQ